MFKESCEPLVRDLQKSGVADHGEIFNNFMIAGEFIIEGLGFDIAARE